MTKFNIKKVLLVLCIFVLMAGITACGIYNKNLKENNGTGNFPETYDLTRPVFSDIGGFYQDDFILKIKFPNMYAANGYSIYYTLDSSEPSADDGFKYTTNGIKIPGKLSTESNGDFVTVVRAACFDVKGNMVGSISTASYIKLYDKNGRYTMPVISLVTDDTNLYHQKTGIFVDNNIRNKGGEWERPVHIEFFESDGKQGFTQDAGIRLFGGSSRGLPQKSFKITARNSSYFNSDKYDGKGEFNYEIFPGRTRHDGTLLNVYDSFILRNGGNDSVLTGSDPERATHIRDGWAARMAEIAAPNVDGMAYRPCVLYLNGSYYGISNIREAQDENYIKNVYGIEDVENIGMISSELDTTKGTRYAGTWFYYVQDSGPEGELKEYDYLGLDIDLDLINYVDLEEQVDIQNVIEYYAYNLFICNTDWPHNNVKIWRYSGPDKEEGTVKDGKWRFMFKDQDLGMGRYILGLDDNAPVELYTKADSKNFRLMLINYIEDRFTNEDYEGYPNVWFNFYPDPLDTKNLINFCLKNEEFKERFTDYCFKLATEILTPDVMIREINNIVDVVKPEMRKHIKNIGGKFVWQATINYDTWLEATLGQSDSLVTFSKERSGRDGYFIKNLIETLKYYE